VNIWIKIGDKEYQNLQGVNALQPRFKILFDETGNLMIVTGF